MGNEDTKGRRVAFNDLEGQKEDDNDIVGNGEMRKGRSGKRRSGWWWRRGSGTWCLCVVGVKASTPRYKV